MNLEDIARSAADDAKAAGRSMPIVPLERSRRRRVLLFVVPNLAGGALAWIVIALTAFPQVEEAPVISSVETTTTVVDEAIEEGHELVFRVESSWERTRRVQIRTHSARWCTQTPVLTVEPRRLPKVPQARIGRSEAAPLQVEVGHAVVEVHMQPFTPGPS